MRERVGRRVHLRCEVEFVKNDPVTSTERREEGPVLPRVVTRGSTCERYSTIVSALNY